MAKTDNIDNVVSLFGHERDKQRSTGISLAKTVFLPEARHILLRDYHLGKNVIPLHFSCPQGSAEHALYQHPDFVAAVKETLAREMQVYVLIKPPDVSHSSLRIQLFRHRDMYWEHWLLYAISQFFWLI